MKTKSGIIKGHKVWWTMDWMRASQASLRAGFIMGFLASIIFDQNTRTGIFAEPNAQLVGLAAIWCMIPSAYSWSGGCLIRHEKGPTVDVPDLELP